MFNLPNVDLPRVVLLAVDLATCCYTPAMTLGAVGDATDPDNEGAAALHAFLTPVSYPFYSAERSQVNAGSPLSVNG